MAVLFTAHEWVWVAGRLCPSGSRVTHGGSYSWLQAEILIKASVPWCPAWVHCQVGVQMPLNTCPSPPDGGMVIGMVRLQDNVSCQFPLLPREEDLRTGEKFSHRVTRAVRRSRPSQGSDEENRPLTAPTQGPRPLLPSGGKARDASGTLEYAVRQAWVVDDFLPVSELE